MFNTINKMISSAVEVIQLYTASLKQHISSGLSNIYDSIRQLLTNKKSEGKIAASPISTAQFAAARLPQKNSILSFQAQGSVKVSEKLNARLKYSLSSSTAAINQTNSRGMLKMAQAEKKLNAFERRMNALAEKFQYRFSEGTATPQARNTFENKKPEGKMSASPISTAQSAAAPLPQKDSILSPQAQGSVSTLATSDSGPSVNSISQEGKFPTYGRAYFRKSPAVPTDEQARLLQSSRYKAVFSKFTGSEAIRQRSVEVSEKLNIQYLLKYNLSYPTAAADQANGRGMLKMTQADKDLNILRRSLEQKIDALVEEFQEVAHKVNEGTATPQEHNTFNFFIEQQNRLLTQFEKDLAAKSKGWES